tara:strand:+ start:2007 stop:2192 length:186 start_codon:yes stop_codon:yes gene_type:complete
MLEEKKPWKSKTLWLNLLVSVGAMLPWAPVAEAMSEGNLVMVLSVVNMVLRLVSKDKIGLN